MNQKIILIMVIMVCLLPLATAVIIEDISYSVLIKFDGENAEPVSAKLVEGKASEGDRTVEYKYSLQLTSFKGEKLSPRGFNLPNYWFDIDVTIENGTFVMYLPYHTNAEKIEVYKEGKKISELDVSEFVSCNEDEFCSVNENLKECPEDCTIKEVEPTAIETPEKAITEQKPAALLEDSKIRLSILIGSILLIILIAVIYFAAKKPRGKK